MAANANALLDESLKRLALNHQQIKESIRKAEEVLALKRNFMEKFSERFKHKQDEHTVIQQKLRTCNEQYLHLSEAYKNKKNEHSTLTTRLSEIQHEISQTEEQIKVANEQEGKRELKRKEHIRVMMESMANDPVYVELLQVQEEVKKLKEKKTQFEEDPTMKLIASGDSLAILNDQNQAMLKASSERWVGVQELEAELKDELDKLAKLKEDFENQRKEQNAELEQLEKELAQDDSQGTLPQEQNQASDSLWYLDDEDDDLWVFDDPIESQEQC